MPALRRDRVVQKVRRRLRIDVPVVQDVETLLAAQIRALRERPGRRQLQRNRDAQDTPGKAERRGAQKPVAPPVFRHLGEWCFGNSVFHCLPSLRVMKGNRDAPAGFHLEHGMSCSGSRRQFPLSFAPPPLQEAHMRSLLDFVRTNAPWLAAGFLLTFASSFGQTFFISVFAGEIRATYGLSHGDWGAIYS